MLKKAVYISILFIVLICSSCSKNESSNNDLNINNDYNINIQNEDNVSFDMKYVYKSVRVDKINFSNALISYYHDINYSNIINRNKDFLNKKLVGDNDIKKYAVDYISNTYHNPYNDSVSKGDLYDGDLSHYYASEYNYVEQNLALKKARELLLSINNKDADIYLALFLSYMASDSLYNFYEIQNYLKEWRKLDSTNINMMIGIVNEGNNINEIYSNSMKLINYIIEAPSNLGAEQLIADAYQNGFLKYISKSTGYLDIYNENNYNLSSILYDSDAHKSYFAVIRDIVNTNIMNKYIRTYSKENLSRDKMKLPVYYQNFYYIDNTYPNEKYDEFSELYFLEFNKNTFVYSIYENKLKEIYYFNPSFIENTRYASFETEEIFNFRLGDDSKLEKAKTSNVKDIADDSQFILNGKFNMDKYTSYLNEILSFPIYKPEFFLCDINNDGKDEIMLRGSYDNSIGGGGKASYTLVLKDNLELDLESTIAKSINGSSKQGLNNFQILYSENGKNKILLVNPIANTAQDIFSENDIVNVDEFKYKNYTFKPKLIWKGSIVNGVPQGALKMDAGFDMNKVKSDSDIAIVSDKTLRAADKLISDIYYRDREKLNEEDEKEKLLESKRAEIKAIQDEYGDIVNIENEMLNILGLDN
ncbi:hypothetical protein [uncultured Brachyspira sp.]|uniref:hypothetical protein n=1 Tax=uncultured Brachyspira sp. TaxID=221953 RepID=UPI002600D49B|nr:hypothetical protein [uncultured Brachyspira sp.]